MARRVSEAFGSQTPAGQFSMKDCLLDLEVLGQRGLIQLLPAGSIRDRPNAYALSDPIPLPIDVPNQLA